MYLSNETDDASGRLGLGIVDIPVLPVYLPEM